MRNDSAHLMAGRRAAVLKLCRLGSVMGATSATSNSLLFHGKTDKNEDCRRYSQHLLVALVALVAQMTVAVATSDPSCTVPPASMAVRSNPSSQRNWPG